MKSVQILKKINVENLLDEITYIEETVEHLENTFRWEMKDFTFTQEKGKKDILEAVETVPSIQHKVFELGSTGEGRELGARANQNWCGITPEERGQLIHEFWGRSTILIHDVGLDVIHMRLVGLYRMADLAKTGELDVFAVIKDIPTIGMAILSTESINRDDSLEGMFKMLYATVIQKAMRCRGDEWFYNNVINNVIADIQKQTNAIREEFIRRFVSLQKEFKITKKVTDEDKNSYW